ncbi:MAG: TIGR03960 family B12-binding radical SAM protein [Desulfobacteraceae bacterium]|nr:TIGR03960 family B12-binding radical SAM protein [Desulfobacteraceae bacterium]
MRINYVQDAHKNTHQDIFALIEKPSRYLGSENNCIQKHSKDVSLRFALAFPDLYEIGTSHFGIQILYSILNEKPYIAAERVFAPAMDMEKQLRANKIPLFSLESRRALSEFDIIGFSLLYELNYTNVLNMLDLSAIALRARDRTAQDPLVIAGGPCVCNPEPMAEFFDVMVFGDAEHLILDLTDQFMDWKKRDGKDKTALLQQLAKIKGIYVPSLFDDYAGAEGFQRLRPKQSEYIKVQRAIVPDLEKAPFPQSPVVPFGRPVHDRLKLEISRGCSRGCRFCQAGMIYRPVRERSPENLIKIYEKALKTTGYEDLSLLSLSTADYTCLEQLMGELMQRCQSQRVSISLPSVRAGKLTAHLMNLIKKVRKTGFTIAPEAGSQRLRDVINKNVTYEDVADTIENAFEAGWKVIKLYYMIGLPTETDEDIDAIISMVNRLKTIKGPKHRRGQINVSITTFIPKAHTPFQWAAQIPLETSREKLDKLKSSLKKPGIKLKWQNPQMSFLEGVLARGDRKLSHVIQTAWQNGSRFDGWTDHFDFDLWKKSFEKCRVDMGFYTTRKRRIDEPLPWDHMQSGVCRDFLRKQWETAQQNGKKIIDCRYGKCHQCGVCDFEHIKPVIYDNCSISDSFENHLADKGDDHYQWLLLDYSKLGQSRFFGHLEQTRLFIRAFRKAGVDVRYSGGFHPMARFRFDNPLPLGMESESEQFMALVAKDINCQKLVTQLNSNLPEGLQINSCSVSPGKKIKTVVCDYYKVDFGRIPLDIKSLEYYHLVENWPVCLYGKKANCRNIDLKEHVCRIKLLDDQNVYIKINRMDTFMIRPAVVLDTVFHVSSENQKHIRIRRLAQDKSV